MLTWGLLGPGKGIEWAIDAMADLDDLRPRPAYVVAGATHPKVREQYGEAYREMLSTGAALDTGVAHVVASTTTYRDLPALTELIRSADLVVLPYDSPTRSPRACWSTPSRPAPGRRPLPSRTPSSCSASGAGIVVPQRDPEALAGAIRSGAHRPGSGCVDGRRGRRLAPELSWARSPRRYLQLGERLVAERTVTR